MTGKQLKNSILQLAIQGKLVPQDPHDEPASELLKRICKEKEQLVKTGKLKKKDLESTPIAEDEKPFEIPESWEWCRLGEYVNVVTDGDHSAPPQQERGVPFVVISCIDGEKINFEKAKFVTPQYYVTLDENRKPKKGDILFTVTGSYGKVIEIFDNRDFCFQRHIALIRPFYYSSYLAYVLRSSFVKMMCDEQATGIAQKTVVLSVLRNLYIPIPPLHEQHRIVEKIEELMPLVEEYDKAQSELDKLNESLPEQLKKSILQQAIMGKLVPQDPNDEPASELLKRIHKEKENLVKSGALKKKDLITTPISDDEKPFEIPESWEWVRLKEIVYNNGQKTPDKTFSYIDIGSINNKTQKLNVSETILEASAAPSRARKIVKMGDIVYSTVRPYLHNMAIIDKDFDVEPIASTGFAVLSTIIVYNKFLFYFLLSPQFDEYANDGDNAKGIAYPAINDEKLYKAIIPLPPLSEQHRIVAKIEELFNILK